MESSAGGINSSENTERAPGIASGGAAIWRGTSMSLLEEVDAMLEEEEPEVQAFFSGNADRQNRRIAKRVMPLCLEFASDGPNRKTLDEVVVNDLSNLDERSRAAFKGIKETVVQQEERARTAFLMFGDRMSPDIWNCCKRLCFASIAIDGSKMRLMQELLLIHRHAQEELGKMENISDRLYKRKRGIGRSSWTFRSNSRAEREAQIGRRTLTPRQEHLRAFAAFVKEVLPFLRAEEPSPRLTPPPPHRLCVQSICCLLGISRNFLYHRKAIDNFERASEDELINIVDSVGLRLRQHRRVGVRLNVPEVKDLPSFECGCETPCLAGVPVWELISEYDDFSRISKQLRARHKENRFLLNKLYVDSYRSPTHVCNTALAALYNVSVATIAAVRMCLNALCHGLRSGNEGELGDEEDDGQQEMAQVYRGRRQRLLEDGTCRYEYSRAHPIRRYPDDVREEVEKHLDMVVRPDPMGANGDGVGRVYNLEINTYQKLREHLSGKLRLEGDVDFELSESTLQRMVSTYLKKHNYSAISFTQSDHNACPTCKAVHIALLQFEQDEQCALREVEAFRNKERPLIRAEQELFDGFHSTISAKRFQQKDCIMELERHNGRDLRIRGFLKSLADYFFKVEDTWARVQEYDRSSVPFEWGSSLGRGLITHQDDMTKVDLPHFVQESSADITRWRFDVNAHVSAVTNDAIVLSHEQGMGAKNASLIVEEVLLEHLLTCRGEAVRILVSDNASVGKNWLTTVALPQYIIDQGLAKVVVIAFLENNHGKWLADMLFGQFQTKKRRQLMFGIDDMLSNFESINRRNGKVRAFAVNPLSSVNFVETLKGLGYEVSPPSKFGFVKRNIHFAAACAWGAKEHLPEDLRSKLGPLLPDDEGMVRLSSEPPNGRAQCELRFEDRYVDVPAATIDVRSQQTSSTVAAQVNEEYGMAPLVVPLGAPFAKGGYGVVSQRTVVKLGYNGIEFSKLDACAEMRRKDSSIVRRAWPKGLVDLHGTFGVSNEPVDALHSEMCAPLNWIVRRPISTHCQHELDWKARYPPRNLLNAKFSMGPREVGQWIPTRTYDEPPFPIIHGTSACGAMQRLAAEHLDIHQSLHTLHALRAVFSEMGDRHAVSDPWLQKRVQMPSRKALDQYFYELDLFVRREEGFPKAVKSLKAAFREDELVKHKVQERMPTSVATAGSATLRRKAEDKIVMQLLSEAESTPGGLDRFRRKVEVDQERFSRELQAFRDRQRIFDEENGLLPVNTLETT